MRRRGSASRRRSFHRAEVSRLEVREDVGRKRIVEVLGNREIPARAARARRDDEGIAALLRGGATADRRLGILILVVGGMFIFPLTRGTTSKALKFQPRPNPLAG
jgi:hypothetical protein